MCSSFFEDNRGFSGRNEMIQDIAPYVYDNQYRKEEAKEEDFLIVYRKGRIQLIRNDEEIIFPQVKDAGGKGKFRYLFCVDNMRWFLLEEGDFFDERCAYYSAKDLRSMDPEARRFAAVTAIQLARWYDEHRICGRCGKPMKHSQTERAMVCDSCGITRYPQICPAVIVAVLKGDTVLVSKYADRHSSYRRYALLAGFGEIGESIEQTVHREVMEEVGLKVKNLTFYKSQPWSFSDSLLMGFFCEVDGDDSITLDENELAMAKFVGPEELPDEADGVSLTSEMLYRFKNGYRR